MAHGAEGRAAMQGDIGTGFGDGVEVMVERWDWYDDHAAAHETICRAGLDGKAQREEGHRVERVVPHGQWSGGASDDGGQ